MREKQKSMQHSATSVPQTPGSPSGSPDVPFKAGSTKWQAGATQRKCANCGQVGHIKTNKKLCPLFKDGKLQEFDNAAFGGGGMPPPGDGTPAPSQTTPAP